MKKLGLAIVALAIAGFVSGPAMAEHIALLGNGLPHLHDGEQKDIYRLAIHGKSNCTDQEFEGSSRTVISVQASFGDFDGAATRHKDSVTKTNDIFLVSGDFAVIDGNACPNLSDDGAKFQLPANISTAWSVWFVLVGQPNTGIDIATCGTVDSELVCGGAIVRVRAAGKPTFEKDVTKKLLTVDGEELFTAATSPFWSVFTQGKMKAKLVFIPE